MKKVTLWNLFESSNISRRLLAYYDIEVLHTNVHSVLEVKTFFSINAKKTDLFL
jgi:hypothetical protein